MPVNGPTSGKPNPPIKPARAADLSKTIRMIRSHLVGDFSVKGTRPIPQTRHPNDRVETYLYNYNREYGETGWETIDMGTTRASESPILQGQHICADQMMVSETPIVLETGAGPCAIVTLYDETRKVGAAIHIDVVNEANETHKYLISLALYKMGALKDNNLSNIKARILGADSEDGSTKDIQIKWVKNISSFLKGCSVQLLPDVVGREIVIRFHLSDGNVEEVKED